MHFSDWISSNYIEIFGAAAGIIYVFLEIRQNIWLWPIGIITSGVYIWVFFSGKLYADMSLQGYYLVISLFGWYWWIKGTGQGAGGEECGAGSMGQEVDAEELPSSEGLGVGLSEERGRGSSFAEATEDKGERETEVNRDSETNKLGVTRLKFKTGIVLSIIFALLWVVMWHVLDRLTDSPVPVWDAFITSLSIIATWMLARKIYEHWFLWIIVNAASVILFITRGLYPTVLLYVVYCAMSFVGLRAWKRTIQDGKTHN